MNASRSAPSLREFRPVRFDDLVRVGRDFDGGYVVPRVVLDGSHRLLSLGVSTDWSFEEGVHERNPGIRITCVDGTTGPGTILKRTLQKLVDMIGYAFTLQFRKLRRNAEYLTKPLAFRRFFSRHEFLRLMVAPVDAPGAITLRALLERGTGDDRAGWTILKVDIEGAEYGVLRGAVDRLQRVSALIAEFHELDARWEEFRSLMSELTTTFQVAHVHGNNFKGYIPGTNVPRALELTLVNRSFVSTRPDAAELEYPVPGLDQPNNWKQPELRISFD